MELTIKCFLSNIFKQKNNLSSMDHLAILDKKRDLMKKILSGEKSIESRWYKMKKTPYGMIKAGDTIYFKDSGEPVTAKARVEKALFFSDLTREKYQEIIEKYGRDYLRYSLTKSFKGDDFSYDEKELAEANKVITILANTHTFISQLERKKAKLKAEDKWILSKYNSFLRDIQKAYNNYKFSEAIQLFENFVVKDVSRTYIQIIRDRSNEVYDVLSEIRKGILQTIAPITPFFTETIWQELKEKKEVEEESIHLSSLPESNKKKIDVELEKNFEIIMKIIESGLAERDKVKIGLRWPLASIEVMCNAEINEDLKEIVARQLNVKNVNMKKTTENKVEVKLDLRMNDELEGEGFAREIARKVQAERKNAGLKKGDLIDLKLQVTEKLSKLLKKYSEFLKERTNSSKFEIVTNTDDKNENTPIVFTVKDEKISIFFRNY